MTQEVISCPVLLYYSSCLVTSELSLSFLFYTEAHAQLSAELFTVLYFHFTLQPRSSKVLKGYRNSRYLKIKAIFKKKSQKPRVSMSLIHFANILHGDSRLQKSNSGNAGIVTKGRIRIMHFRRLSTPLKIYIIMNDTKMGE